jgi:hypothetical protein
MTILTLNSTKEKTLKSQPKPRSTNGHRQRLIDQSGNGRSMIVRPDVKQELTDAELSWERVITIIEE